MRALALALLGLALVPASAAATPGDVDPGFGARGVTTLGTAKGQLVDGAIDADDRVVVVGSIDGGPGGPRTTGLVSRLSAAGTPDEAFAGDGVFTGTFGYQRAFLNEVEVMPAGDLLVRGTSGAGGSFLAVLSSDGALDEAFAGDGVLPLANRAWSVAVQANGRILVARDSPGGGRIVRLDAGGEPDEAFGDEGEVAIAARELEVAGGGRILAGSFGGPDGAGLVRLLPGGELDESFAEDGIQYTGCIPCGDIVDLAPTPDGGVVAVMRYSAGSLGAIARLDDAGEFDEEFLGGGFVQLGPGADLGAVAVDADGRIAFAQPRKFRGNDRSGYEVARLLESGRSDPAFQGGERAHVNFTDKPDVPSAVEVLPSGRILALGAIGGKPSLVGFTDSEGPGDRDADGVSDQTDPCPARTTTTPGGCPLYEPQAVLGFATPRRGGAEFAGYVTSARPACHPKNPWPRVFEKRPGPDRMLGRANDPVDEALRGSPSIDAAFALDRTPVAGRTYYARVPRLLIPALGICEAARSADVAG
jgi:uncharacterized delta-60 repeat protein